MSALDVIEGRAKSSIEKADCLSWLKSLPEQSAGMVFGSPPYENARLYLENGENLGIARDTEQWVAWMIEVTKAALRVSRGLVAWVVEGQTKDYRYSCGPALLIADLCRAGVCLRKPPIYRRVGIPGSGGPDWLRNDYEFIVCCTNGGRLPWSNNTAMGSPPKYEPGGKMTNRTKGGKRVHERNFKDLGKGGHLKQHYTIPDVVNPGNVISCNAGGGHLGSSLAHENEAPFPESLAEFFVRSFCAEDDIVVDPFSGSGTTGAVALRWGRRFMGCDLRQSQVDLTTRRLKEEAGLFDHVEIQPKE